MNIKVWQSSCFFLLVMGLSVLMFPGRMTMLPLYLEAGLMDQARQALSSLLPERPADPRLRLMAAELQQKDGDPEASIRSLSEAVGLLPERADLWARLGQYLEWDLRPGEAQEAWERAAAAPDLPGIGPVRLQAARRVADFLRHQGRTEAQGLALGRVLELERGEPRAWMDASPPARVLTARMERLARELPQSREPLLTALYLAGLHAARHAYLEDLAEGRDSPQRRWELAGMGLEAAANAAEPAEAWDLAAELDREAGLDLAARLHLATILGWRGEQAAVLPLLAGLCRERPEDPRPLEAMATAALDGGLADAAVEALEGLSRLRPGDVSVALRLAQALEMKGDSGRAADHLADLARRLPEDREVLDRALAAALFSGQAPAMARAAGLALALRPGDPDFTERAAGLLLAAGRPDQALPLIADLARTAGGDRERTLRLLQAARLSGDPRAALEAATLLLAPRSDDPEVLAQAAEAYLGADRPDLAYPALRKLADLRGGTREDLLRLLEVAGFAGNPSLARDAATLALRTQPRDPEVLGAAVQVLEAAGELGGAASALAALSAQRPGDEALARKLAELYAWTDAPDQALAVFKALLARRPGDQALALETARLAEAAGDSETAFALYHRLYKADPRNAARREDCRRLAEWTGRQGLLAGFLGQDSDADPKSYAKAVQAGQAFQGADDSKGAVPFFERAAALRPQEAAPRQALAALYGDLGQEDRRVAVLEWLEPRGLLARQDRLDLARAALDRRNPALALSRLGFLETDPQASFDELGLVVQARLQTADLDGAVRMMKRLAAENPRSAPRLAALGDLALAAKRTGLALEFYEAALKTDPRNGPALKGSAQVYAWNNDPNRAMARLEAYRVVAPDDAEARYLLGELYFVNQKESAAMGEYDQTLKLLRKARKERQAAKAAAAGGRP